MKGHCVNPDNIEMHCIVDQDDNIIRIIKKKVLKAYYKLEGTPWTILNFWSVQGIRFTERI